MSRGVSEECRVERVGKNMKRTIMVLALSAMLLALCASASRRTVQSRADSGLPTQLIPVAFCRVNHTFLYLYPRDR